MGRGAYELARVAVMVRAAALWWWWLGVIAALAGVFVPGVTGRMVGVVGGAALFLVGGATAFLVRRKDYAELRNAAARAAKTVVLQDRRVTGHVWLRARRWWLLLALAVAVTSSLAAPAAGGMLLAGAGAGLWAKAVLLGRWERRYGTLLWVRPEWARGSGPAGKDVKSYLTTGPVAGDARPGGGKRRALSAGAAR